MKRTAGKSVLRCGFRQNPPEGRGDVAVSIGERKNVIPIDGLEGKEVIQGRGF